MQLERRKTEGIKNVGDKEWSMNYIKRKEERMNELKINIDRKL